MSGPKDYAFIFVAERLAEIRQRHQAAREARSAAVEFELARARQRAAGVRASADAARTVAILSDLERCAAQTRQELADLKTNAEAQPRAQQMTPAIAEKEQSGEQDKILRVDMQAILDGWSVALANDAAVGSFAAPQFAEWTRRAQALREASIEEFVAKADALTREAISVHSQAGDVQASFDTRNELLHDVIESLKEMGYFVSDPYFANPADPTSPAILKAVCGSEVVTTSIDLSSMVRSVWDGQEHEYCKNSFFDYMESMKARGVNLTPEREDLRERPILKQQGANELPRSDGRDRQAGA